MPKYEKYPDQAEAAMREASDEMERLDDALAIARERAEALEGEIDTAYEAGDEAKLASLQLQHELAERVIEDLSNDLKGAESYLHSTSDFWGFTT